MSQFDNVPAHGFRLRVIRVMLQEVLQDARGFGLLAAPQVDLREVQLGMREVRRIELARPLGIKEIVRSGKIAMARAVQTAQHETNPRAAATREAG